MVEQAQQYDAGSRTGILAGGRGAAGGGASDVEVNTAVVTPTDRVRWGPILAGLFAALSTLAVLSVLGVAIAGSAYDPGDRARTFGIGAGIWGAVSMLLAFAVGGWLAARSAAVRGHHNGLLNGAMVWAVAIPLILYTLASGVGAAARSAGSVAQTGAQVAAQVSDDATAASTREDAEGMANQAQAAAANAQNRVSAAMTPENKERAADATAKTAWGTLISLLLGLAAASAGGYLGARGTEPTRGFATA